MGRTKKSPSRATAEIAVEMAKPRVGASVGVDANVFSYLNGVFARVARKLDVSPSMVSRVANGHRFSPKIQAALRDELKLLKQKLDSISL
jgi:hypothetical protein